jgi:hypothetical protein
MDRPHRPIRERLTGHARPVVVAKAMQERHVVRCIGARPRRRGAGGGSPLNGAENLRPPRDTAARRRSESRRPGGISRQELLYGLYALISVHFWKEEDIFSALLDNRAERSDKTQQDR